VSPLSSTGSPGVWLVVDERSDDGSADGEVRARDHLLTAAFRQARNWASRAASIPLLDPAAVKTDTASISDKPFFNLV
jgi:hypothetical protein